MPRYESGAHRRCECSAREFVRQILKVPFHTCHGAVARSAQQPLRGSAAARSLMAAVTRCRRDLRRAAFEKIRTARPDRPQETRLADTISAPRWFRERAKSCGRAAASDHAAKDGADGSSARLARADVHQQEQQIRCDKAVCQSCM